MDINNCVKRENHRKSVIMNIRITKDISRWMKEKNLSPTAIFYEAIKELGYKPKGGENH